MKLIKFTLPVAIQNWYRDSGLNMTRDYGTALDIWYSQYQIRQYSFGYCCLVFGH